MHLNDQQMELIRGLTSTPPALSIQEFCERWPTEPTGLGTLVSKILGFAEFARDPRGVRWGLALARHLGVLREELRPILSIAREEWHHSHEDIVFALAELRTPEALSVFATLVNARFGYLAWDDARALAVKCIWGLGKLGTCEAVAELAKILSAEEPILATNARRQLEQIMSGPGDPEAVDLARAALACAPALDEDSLEAPRVPRTGARGAP
ncbi:hypothetical protein L6R49_22905 [Myxococcota bacterium]|nr:hypothetical protein [Myxococcota bacterium]